MDALMAAFVGAILCQASDRTPWLAARLGDRYHRPGQLIVAAILALSIINALGAVAGILMAPLMTPNARALLLGLALVSGGVAALLPLKPPAGLKGGAGAFLSAFLCILAMGIGDRTQFLTAAIATRTPIPAFAAIGGTLGSMVVVIPALLAGESSYRRLPRRALRLVIGGVLFLVGLAFGLGALRLL